MERPEDALRERTRQLIDACRGSRFIEIGQPHFTGMPCSPNHPDFRMTLIRRHGDVVRPDGGSGANEIIVTGGHVGTHVDALAHVSQDGQLHGGVDAAEAQSSSGFSSLGAECTPVMMSRGVLLDVAAAHGVDTLPAGYGVTPEDLQRCADRAGLELSQRDVVLIRTGWARHFSEPARYLGQVEGAPGVNEAAAEWLAAAQIRAAGADTTAFEQIKPGAGHTTLPVHRILIVHAGIHIIEHLNLEQLSQEGVAEFLFVMAPLRLVGATGSPIRPVAVVSH